MYIKVSHDNNVCRKKIMSTRSDAKENASNLSDMSSDIVHSSSKPRRSRSHSLAGLSGMVWRNETLSFSSLWIDDFSKIFTTFYTRRTQRSRLCRRRQCCQCQIPIPLTETAKIPQTSVLRERLTKYDNREKSLFMCGLSVKVGCRLAWQFW